MEIGLDTFYRARNYQEVAAAATQRTGAPVKHWAIDDAPAFAFRNARESVRLFSGSLDPAFYGAQETHELLKQFLSDPKHSLKIMIGHVPGVDKIVSHFLRGVPATAQVEVRLLDKNMGLTAQDDFILVDDYAMTKRVEGKASSRFEPWGEASTPTADELWTFDELWAGAVPMPIRTLTVDGPQGLQGDLRR